MLKKFLYLLVISSLCLNLACNKIFNRKKDADDQAGSKGQIAVSLTAEQFCTDLDDPQTAPAKYQYHVFKTIELTGTIYNYSRDRDGVVVLHFDTSKFKGSPFMGIRCRMEDPTPWTTSHPGQQIKLVGILQPLEGFRAQIDKCQITETTGPQLAVLDAADLEARYEGNMEALKPHVYKKRFFVEGTVIEGKDRGGRPIPSFATKSKYPVAIEYPFGSSSESGRLKVGEKGRVLAVIDGFNHGNYQLVLTDAIVVSGEAPKK